MATDSILGLFTTPEQYQLAQQQAQMEQARAFAAQDPMQRAVASQYFAGGQLGRALGGTDPQLQLMSLRTSVMKGVDPNDSTSLAKAAQALAQAGDQQGAFQLAQAALGNRNIESQIAGRTEEKQAQRDMQLQLARERIQANIDIARERGATQLQIAQMMQEGRTQLAQLAASLKSEKATAAPVVADDKSATRIGQNTVFDTLISEGDTLTQTIDANKDSFSLGGRAATAIKSVMNPSAPSVQAVSDVDSYLKKARNAYLLAAKGTQTEGDAQRAWEEFAGRLDFSSAEGAKRSVERIQKELSTQKQANEAYLKSRGIQSGAALGTKENPIKLK